MHISFDWKMRRMGEKLPSAFFLSFSLCLFVYHSSLHFFGVPSRFFANMELHSTLRVIDSVWQLTLFRCAVFSLNLLYSSRTLCDSPSHSLLFFEYVFARRRLLSSRSSSFLFMPLSFSSYLSFISLCVHLCLSLSLSVPCCPPLSFCLPASFILHIFF